MKLCCFDVYTLLKHNGYNGDFSYPNSLILIIKEALKFYIDS